MCIGQIDFTLCAGVLFVLMMCLMLFGFAVMIVYLVSGPNLVGTSDGQISNHISVPNHKSLNENM